MCVNVNVFNWPSKSTLWPSLTLYVAVIVYGVAVTDMYCGRHCLWPLLIWPSCFVTVMDLTVIDRHVAVMICGRHRRFPSEVRGGRGTDAARCRNTAVLIYQFAMPVAVLHRQRPPLQ